MKTYQSTFAGRLMEVARNREASWDLRRTAVLMLEGQALRMWNAEGFGESSLRFLNGLGLIANGQVRETVLREGYTSLSPETFAKELRDRVGRLHRIHEGMNGWNTKEDALEDFIHVCRLDCKLTLARYLFDPVEVAQRVLREVNVTPGLAPSGSGDIAVKQQCSVFDEIVMQSLRRGRKVLWVAPLTSSRLNSLVEYPLGTVALVIKPPGSDVEFEVKRAGMRGEHSLNVLYDRGGFPVPVHHRLQGASSAAMLEFETYASRRYASIYRHVHGVDPPMSRLLGYTAISHVPLESGHVHVLDYLSKREVFGSDFDRMRNHLQRCVEAYEGEHPRQDLPGELGWTMRFFNRTVPNQAWIEGTTSFRLDRLVTLLSANGPRSYFGTSYTDGDARRLADEVLEEVLGVLEGGPVWTSDYTAYVEAVLSVPANRAAADAAYVDAVKETGLYWGTLLGIGGYTEGESFVTRNVGLKSRWIAGRWRARICFMDHDNMLALGAGEIPHLVRTVESVRLDEMWVCGDADRCMMTCLRKIYLVGQELETQGQALLRTAMASAYRATRRAMLDHEPVRHLFDADYISSLLVKDAVVRLYLSASAAKRPWRRKASKLLEATVYRPDTFGDFLDILVRNDDMLRRYSFLLDSVD